MPKIPALPSESALSAEDYLVIDDGSTTSKIPISSAYASASAPGLVSTAAQTFAGKKSFSESPVIAKTNNYPELELKTLDASNDWVGLFGGSRGGSVNLVYAQVKSRSGAGSDMYMLPTKNLDDTTSGQYNILTSKTPVSIAQGGTGSSGNVQITPTAGSGVTINAHSIYRWGNIVCGWARITVSSAIAAYGTIIGELPQIRNRATFPLYTSYNTVVANQGVYFDDGLQVLRASAQIPAGSYVVSFTYLTY